MQDAVTQSLEEDNRQIRAGLDELKKLYEVETLTQTEEAEIQERLAMFEALSVFQEVFIYGGVKLMVEGFSCYFLVLSLNYQQEGLTAYQGQTPGLTKLSYAGLTTLNKDYGNANIRPETFFERTLEVFNPTKVRFDSDKEFNKRYRVEAEEPEKLKTQASPAFLQTIKAYESLTLELKGKNLLGRLPKGLSAEVAKQLAGFLTKISKVG